MVSQLSEHSYRNVIESLSFTVHGKRQTSDSSWHFLKTENEQTKTAQKILMDKKMRETTNLCVEIRTVGDKKGKLGHVVQIWRTCKRDT